MQNEGDSVKSKKEMNVVVDPSASTMFADQLHINSRADGLHLLRFLVQLPEVYEEQARIVVTNERLREILTAICRHLDYYPEKEPREDS